MSVLSLDEAKTYLHCDLGYTDEDTDIQSLIDTAEKYLLNAGCTLKSDDPTAKLAEKMLVNHWYNNREPTENANKLLSYGLPSLIIQLQNCYSDTTTS